MFYEDIEEWRSSEFYLQATAAPGEETGDGDGTDGDEAGR